MPTAPSQFTVTLTRDSICTVSTRSNHTPPSTPVRRAALGAMSGNELGDLTRIQIAAGKGRKTSIVGAGESMEALREAAAAQIKMVDAAVKQAMGPFEVQMKEQAEEMRRMKLALGVADARLDGIEREKVMELRPLVLLGVVCYINSKIVGAKPTEVDESSNHSEKLQKLVAQRKGLITSNSALRDLLSQEKVMQITSLLDVKERHYLAHPDLQPGLMMRKLFLLERAMLEVGDKNSEVVTDLLKVVLLVTPMKDRTRWIKEWEEDIIIGWQKYNPEQIGRFVDFI